MLNTLRKLGILRSTSTRQAQPSRAPAAGRSPQSAPMLMEELEPRILHSADLSPLFGAEDSLAPLSENQWTEPQTVNIEPAALVERQAPALELVFVDTTTPDYRTLLDDVTSGSDAQRNFEVVLLDSDRDGVAQISDALAGRNGVTAVHVVSHGSDGSIQLGGSRLTQQNLAAYAEDIAGWNRALTDEADLLLYGCDLANSDQGRDLVTGLSALTGADVAASDDLTGHTSLGGDWDLEYSAGNIEADVAFSVDAQNNWVHVLAWFDAGTGTPLAGPTSGADLFVGSAGNDIGIDAGNGNNVLYGKAGDDELTGGNQVDLLLGGAGNDVLKGGNQDDILQGGAGDDDLQGENGADVLIGDGGNDTLDGGNGSDLFLFSGAQHGDVYTVDGGNGPDTIDISEFGAGNVTTVAGTITVDLGAGQSFTINHTNVENIVLAESVGNHAVQADAGVDQTVATSSLVTLDASASVDLDLDPLTYDWQQIEGTWVTLSDPTAVSPTFTAPASAGVLRFAVTVSDGVTRNVDIVTVIADPGAPVNDAPVVAAPATALNATEQTALAIHGSGFTVSDADASGGSASATLSVGEGTITVVEGNSGVVITGGNGSASVTLTGTIAELNNLLTGAGTGTITYLNSSDTPGAATTLTVTVNDQGNTGSDPGLTGDASSEEGSNNVIINVAAVNDAPTGIVSISGTPTEDQVLRASNTLADADGLGSVKYFWQRGGSDISGATGSSYTLTDADVGANISVVARYTDGQGTFENVASARTGPVVNVNDAPTGSVSISGTPTEDQVLTASDTLADADGLGSVKYFWQRNGRDISGATGNSYTLTDADVGANIGVVARYTDGQGTFENVASARTGPVVNINDAPTGSVSISGTPTEDQVLTASNTLADADGLGSVKYFWQRDGSDISGATGSSYTLTDADVGANISVVARYTDGQGTFENVASARTGPVVNVNDAPTGSVSISGSATEHEVLRVDTSRVADADGLSTFSYQWLRGGVSITGANASTYTVASSDIGATISVKISYTDSHGTAESLSSAGVVAVASNTTGSPALSIAVDPATPGPGKPQTEPQPESTGPAAEPADTEPPANQPSHASVPVELVAGGSGGGAVPPDTVPGNTRSGNITEASVRPAADAQESRATRLEAAPASFDFREFIQQEIDTALNNVTFVVTPPMSLPSFSAGLGGIESADFVDELDNLRDTLEEQTRYAGTLVTSNLVLTAGVSLGYLFWMLRAEVLLGSLLTSLPAWRLVDPLPVLDDLAAEDSEEDDESLESLVESGNRAAHASDMQDIQLP